MFPQTLRYLFAASLFVSASAGVSAWGQTAVTDPVGMVSVSLGADSDTYVSIPFKRAPEYSGLASGALGANSTYDVGESYTDDNTNGSFDTGESFVDSNNVLPISGSPNFAVGKFAYAAGTQPKRYYVLLLDGAKAGMYYSIVSSDVSSVTLDLAGDNLGSAVANGTRIQIIPFDTLASLFPSGQSVSPTTSHSSSVRQTEILIPDHTTSGINLAANVFYYYYSGTTAPGAGWRKAGAASRLADDDILYPDSYFIVRHKAGFASTLTFTGTVAMSNLQTPLSVETAKQDNAVALPVAVPITLAQTNLFESGAFVGSATHSSLDRKDVLLVWDGTDSGHNRAATRSYYYYTGTAGQGTGWRKEGDAGTKRDSTPEDVILGSTSTIVIRKSAGLQAGTVFWSVKPPYVP